jgi:hypothetical protein
LNPPQDAVSGSLNRAQGLNPSLRTLTTRELQPGSAAAGNGRAGLALPNGGGSLLAGGTAGGLGSLGLAQVLQGSSANGLQSLTQPQTLVGTGSIPLPQESGAAGLAPLAQVQTLFEPAGPAAADLAKNTDKNGRSDRDEFSKRKDTWITSGPDAVTNRGSADGKPAVVAAESPKPEAVVETVAGSIIAHSQLVQREGSTEFHLRLEPPELGSVHIHLTATDQGISARLFVHEPGARQLLQSQLESLRQRLQQEGLTLGRFDVAGQGGGASGHGQGQSQSYASQPLAGGGPAKLGPVAATVPRSWTVQTVDVVV